MADTPYVDDLQAPLGGHIHEQFATLTDTNKFAENRAKAKAAIMKASDAVTAILVELGDEFNDSLNSARSVLEGTAGHLKVVAGQY